MTSGFLRRREVRLLVVSLILAAIIVAVGFGVFGGGGGNSGGGDATTVSGGDATAVATGSPAAAAEPKPTVVGSSIHYPAHGYDAVMPEGWHSNAGGIVAGLTKIDTFFSAAPVDGVQANLSVTCEGDPGAVSTDEFATNRVATITKRGATDLKSLDPVTVAGQQAQVVSYTITRDQLVVRQYDAMFVTPACAWTIGLATAPSAEAANKPLFDQFLQSFKLLNRGASTTPTN
jgi:hypothetical protein